MERDRYTLAYRAAEAQQVMDWIRAGQSGCLVGLHRTGKSTFVRFLLRQDTQHHYLGQAHADFLFILVALLLLTERTEWKDGQCTGFGTLDIYRIPQKPTDFSNPPRDSHSRPIGQNRQMRYSRSTRWQIGQAIGHLWREMAYTGRSRKSVKVFSDNDRQQFKRVLAKALRSKGNVLTLARCARQLRLKIVEERAGGLVSEEGIVTDIDRGRALWGLLREAIDRLQPAASEPEPTPAWRLYAIAEGVYVQGKSAGEMADRLGISERTLYRERRAAVEALTTVIWQIERQMCSRGN
jgi:hypothetical protein